MGRGTRWAPVVAALSVVLSAAIGVVTNVVTESAGLIVVAVAGGLVLVAAGLAWLDGRSRVLTEMVGAGAGQPALAQPPAREATVVIRYTSDDRAWAQWIRAELAVGGVGVTLDEIARPCEDGEVVPHGTMSSGADQVLVIASRNSITRFGPAPATGEGRPSAAGSVFVRVDEVGLPASDRGVLDLAGLPADRARLALWAEVGVMPPAGGGGVDGIPFGNPQPFPGTPPRVWSVPPRNPAFVGREAMLVSLRQRLAAGATVVVPEALHGLGGVGKTQTAVEYAHRFATDYDLVWWIPAEHLSQVRVSLASLAARLDIPTGEGMTDSVTAVLDALRQGRPYARWLLIYDNAEDPAQLQDLMPHGVGHVLITSRDHAWASWAKAVELDVFDREESLALLHRRVPDLPDSHARAVAEKLGDLPLAIEQAGVWLATTAMPADRYLDLLDTQPVRVLDDSPPSSYGRAVSATWLLSLERLRSMKPAAATLLELCACFGPEPIPLALLNAQHLTGQLGADPSIRDPVLHARVIRDVGQSALARVDPARSTLQMHRLVRAVIRATLGAQQLGDNHGRIRQILQDAVPDDAEDPANWQAYEDLWPHVVATEVVDSPAQGARKLIASMVRYFWARGDYRGSEELIDAALLRWHEVIGKEDPITVQLRTYLGNTKREQAQYNEAYEIDVDLHVRATQICGADHPHTLLAANALACDLRIRGEYTRAHELDNDTVSRCRRVLGDDDPLTLTSVNNLAVSLRSIGDFRTAAVLDKDTLHRYRQRHGGDHPRALRSARNYAIDLRWTGDLPGSRAILEESLAASRRIEGPDHPSTLFTATCLAVTLRRLGEYGKAHALTTDTLARYEPVLGSNHLHTLACAVNLACEQSALGDHATARATATRTLARYRSMFGDEHSLSLVCANNVAVFLNRLDDRPAALALSELVATGFRRSLGCGHPYTLASMTNLANAAYAMRRYRQALDLDEVVYGRSLEVLGESHYQTLAFALNLATSRHHAGDRRSARNLCAQITERSRLAPGSRHSTALTARSPRRLRLGCDLEPQPT